MLPPMSPATLTTDEQRAKLAEVVTAAHRRYNQPPNPVLFLDRFVDASHTSRFTWTQPASGVSRRTEGSNVDEVRRIAAETTRATPNPLRELAAALLTYADLLDRQGVVPLGVHMCTTYQSLPEHRMYLDDNAEVAAVTTTVRGVSREWVDHTLNRDEAS